MVSALTKLNRFSGLLTFLTILSAILLNFIEFKADIREVSASVKRANESCGKSHIEQEQTSTTIIGKLEVIRDEQQAQAVHNRFLLKMAENSDNSVTKMNNLLDKLIYIMNDMRSEGRGKIG